MKSQREAGAMRQKLQRKNPEDAYVNAAILHLERLEAGDSRGSNAAHDHLIKSIRAIRNYDDRGKSFLSGLLSHENENVRLWSASHLLPLQEKKALDELQYLTKSAISSIVRSSAEVTSSEWRKGTLNIDWFLKK